MLTLGNALAVALGAALGALARWLLSLWFNVANGVLPWGTLVANLVGAYLMGLVLGYCLHHAQLPLWGKLFLTTGLLGGLTTFSTFSAETVGFLEKGAHLQAFGYAGVSLLGSLALTAAGLLTISALR